MEQLFWKVVISKEEYKILNCSKSMISWIADGLFDDFFKYVDEQFREEIMQYFKSGSDEWFLLVINKNGKKELFCIRRLHFKVESLL